MYKRCLISLQIHAVWSGPSVFLVIFYSIHWLCKWSAETLRIKTWIDNTPPLSCGGQITLSKVDVICLNAIPNQISTISMHIPSLVKIFWIDIYSSYHLEIKIQSCGRQITLSKIDEICPLAIPNQISTISMHIPSLVKIHCCLLKLSSRSKRQTEGWMDIWQTNRYTDAVWNSVATAHDKVYNINISFLVFDYEKLQFHHCTICTIWL